MSTSNISSISSLSGDQTPSAESSFKPEELTKLEESNPITPARPAKRTARKFFTSNDGKKIYVCYLETCSRQFHHLSSVIKHERIHRNERPYVCETCGQSFTQSSNLRRHERTHTGDKPYKCKSCSREFSTARNLRAHESVHENVNINGDYSCSKCGKCYTYASSLIKHQSRCSNVEIKAEAQEVSSEVKIEEDLRKIIKTEENSKEICKATEPTAEANQTALLNEPMQRVSPWKNQAPSGWSNLVNTGNITVNNLNATVNIGNTLANNRFLSMNLHSVQPTTSFSVFPQQKTPLEAYSQALYNAGLAASRVGFGYNNGGMMTFSEQIAPTNSLYNVGLPSNPLIQTALEQRLIEENWKLRRTIQSRMFRNSPF